jgi:hypothetical protein
MSYTLFYSDNRIYSIVWVNNKGQIHKEDGPAIEYNSGEKRFYKNGFLHRENGPAIIFSDGAKSWYINGSIHAVSYIIHAVSYIKETKAVKFCSCQFNCGKT